MTAAPIWQTVVFAASAAMASTLQLTLNLDLGRQLLLLAPLIVILGLPHGALDLPVAEALWPLKGWRGKLKFVTVYLGLAATVIAAWVLVPGVALITFLSYSVVHFSDDWSRAVSPLRWTGGLAAIGAPALLQHSAVTRLFSYLAPSGVADVCADVAAVGGGLALCLLIGTLLLKPQARGQAAIEQIILWCSAAVLPPLVFFAVYFCGLHSVRHFRATLTALPQARRAMHMAVVLSGLVTIAALAAILVTEGSFQAMSHGTAMRIIFIGLAALTVPHMFLVDRFWRLRSPEYEPSRWRRGCPPNVCAKLLAVYTARFLND
ncbi:Brp/Blh family beta-carotene 15,15'-dioxygenase [Loktanella sp. SALINAS62]|uniref:Brp/Blh family beta-carotene 15,15'-dioxygenase n=1 Tax=Loktanella sp. SALINAS62 TaxID=2706124 RepID=UPI001B8D14E6|nr:Brp/Blh family beta-carotene 15,15'-dioxygenase [Loktanella sp. SALINAS62]MBS1303385.1 beta-carotene 15,15'-dioxygenase, Brp/Blh family [Loktanella sp. SALINAS62]